MRPLGIYAHTPLVVFPPWAFDPYTGSSPRTNTFSNGNKTVTRTGGASWGSIGSNLAKTTGKFYLECLFYSGAGGNANVCLGIFGHNAYNGLPTWGDTNNYLGFVPRSVEIRGYGYGDNDGASFVAGQAEFQVPNNSWVFMAVDVDARLVWFRRQAGTMWNNSATADPATGVGGQKLSGTEPIRFGITTYSNTPNDAMTVNVGDTAFVGTPPSGFLPWKDPTGNLLIQAPTGFNAGDAGAGITLPNAQQAAIIQKSTAASYALARAVNPRSTGKVYFEMLGSSTGSANQGAVICDASAALNVAAGADTHSIRITPTGGVIFNGVTLLAGGWGLVWAAATNERLAVAYDIAAGLLWIRGQTHTNWNNNASANPATGVGGLACKLAGPAAYIAGQLYDNTAPDQITLNACGPFNGGLPVFAPPSGFVGWDWNSNFAQLNPRDKAPGVATISADGLTFGIPGGVSGGWLGARGMCGKPVSAGQQGRWYFEVTFATAVALGRLGVGVAEATASLTSAPGDQVTPAANAMVYKNNGGIEWNNALTYNGGAAFQTSTAGQTVAICVDQANRRFYCNPLTAANTGGWNGASANPAGNTGGYQWAQQYAGAEVYPYVSLINSSAGDPAISVTFNFGQTPFVGAIPAGFVPWG